MSRPALHTYWIRRGKRVRRYSSRGIGARAWRPAGISMASVTGTGSRSSSIYLASVTRLSSRKVRTRSATATPLPAHVLPGQWLAVAKEASRRAAVGKGSTPHHARSTLCHRPGAKFLHTRSGSGKARVYRIDEHTAAFLFGGQLRREGVQRRLGDAVACCRSAVGRQPEPGLAVGACPLDTLTMRPCPHRPINGKNA